MYSKRNDFIMGEYVEEFLKIDWSKGDAAVSNHLKQKFSTELEMPEAGSYEFRLLYEFENYLNVEDKQEEDKMKKPKVKNFQKYVPGYNPNIQLQMTCFSKTEMRKFFSYKLKENNNEVSGLSETDRKEFNAYMHRALKEQEQYAKLAIKYWNCLNCYRIFHINESTKLYMDNLWMQKIETMKQHYPKTYRPVSSLSFLYCRQETDTPVFMTHLHALQIQNSIKMIELPEPWKHITVPLLYETLVEGKNPLFPSLMKPVGHDKTAFEFVQEFKADVVISASALKTLANNVSPFYTSEWNVIVTVKEFKCGNRNKKVVFVDKPLPPSTLTNTEYSKWHTKIACKMLLAGIKEREKSRSSKQHIKKRSVSVCDNDNDSWTTYESCTESCGHDVLTHSFDGNMRCKNVYENDDDDWTTHESNTETCRGSSGSESSFSCLKSKKKQPTSQKTKEMGSHEVRNSASSVVKEEVKCRQSDYTYRLWKLHSDCDNSKIEVKQKRHIKYANAEIKPLIIIIRNKIHGFISKDGYPKNAAVSSKVEYQPDLGAESMLQNELIKEWFDLLLTPMSYLVRVRVSYKGEYIMVEEKNISDVEDEAKRLYKFDLKSTLKILQIVLCQLCSLKKPGEYLLHSSNSNDFAQIYTAVQPTTQNVFNLHDFYENQWLNRLPNEQSKRIPWRPLDMTIFTPLHYHLKYVPGMYKPKYSTLQADKNYNHLSNVKNSAKKAVQKRACNKDKKKTRNN